MIALKHVSVSSIKVFDQCPAQWAYQYLEGHRSPSGKYADIGTAAHTIVQAYLNKQVGHPLMHNMLASIPDANEREATVHYALSRENKRDRLIGTEIEFLVEVIPGVYVKGFMDAVYWHPDGTLEIEDHKTNRQRETADEWAQRIQPRLYALVARQFLWPQAKRVRFTIGYVMIGGEASWETDPEWDDDTRTKLQEAWERMNSGTHEETVGEHCQYCQLTATCETYKETIMGLASSIIPMLREEHPGERLGRLKGLKKLLDKEIEATETELIALVRENGRVIAGGQEWSMNPKIKRVAPEFTELWTAMMGPEGYDSDGIDALFSLAPKLFTVKLGGIDVLVKEHGQAAERVRPLIQKEPGEELVGAPLEKIIKKSSKKAPKTSKPR